MLDFSMSLDFCRYVRPGEYLDLTLVSPGFLKGTSTSSGPGRLQHQPLILRVSYLAQRLGGYLELGIIFSFDFNCIPTLRGQ